MSSSHFEDGKLILRRSSEDRTPLIQRLNRIEGQVRGLKAMIEADRYCPDELHQIKAVTAGLKQLAILIAGQHLAADTEHAADPQKRKVAQDDMMRVLEQLLKF